MANEKHTATWGIIQTHADLAALLTSLKSLCDGDCAYVGNEIHIKCDSHADALKRMREARATLAKALP